MANNDLNKTHILVLGETNGIFEKVEMPIDRPEQFLNEIHAMADNPNRTVMDMQTHFISFKELLSEAKKSIESVMEKQAA
jgi:hypothetical protein